MLGLAVGIDYALFILARHRQNMADGMEPREAAAQATGTAGSAVVFAGMTVVIALLGLMVVGIPFLTVMGLAAAGAVIVAVLIATTLLPALLRVSGRRVTRKNRVLMSELRPLATRTASDTSRPPSAAALGLRIDGSPLLSPLRLAAIRDRPVSRAATASPPRSAASPR